MIEIDGLTKRYGDKTAVDGLSFVVEPGVVTGFLGPNGAGKSTTMRMIAGLDRPTSGTVRVNGKHFPEAPAPMAELAILLDARSVHPGLSARNNLLALARTAGIGRRRVDEVIELAGLAEVAGTRAGGFSLGMGQRLGVAAALLGQPQTVVLDEPVNGLDPDGVRWIRELLKSRRHGHRARPRASKAGPGDSSGTGDPGPRHPRGVDQAAGTALDPVVRAGRGRTDRRPGCRDRRVRDAVQGLAGQYRRLRSVGGPDRCLVRPAGDRRDRGAGVQRRVRHRDDPPRWRSCPPGCRCCGPR